MKQIVYNIQSNSEKGKIRKVYFFPETKEWKCDCPFYGIKHKECRHITIAKAKRSLGVCPICGNDLQHLVDEENETNIACTKCDFKEFRP